MSSKTALSNTVTFYRGNRENSNRYTTNSFYRWLQPLRVIWQPWTLQTSNNNLFCMNLSWLSKSLCEVNWWLSSKHCPTGGVCQVLNPQRLSTILCTHCSAPLDFCSKISEAVWYPFLITSGFSVFRNTSQMAGPLWNTALDDATMTQKMEVCVLVVVVQMNFLTSPSCSVRNKRSVLNISLDDVVSRLKHFWKPRRDEHHQSSEFIWSDTGICYLAVHTGFRSSSANFHVLQWILTAS